MMLHNVGKSAHKVANALVAALCAADTLV